jgi:hypothetical protein
MWLDSMATDGSQSILISSRDECCPRDYYARPGRTGGPTKREETYEIIAASIGNISLMA